LYSGVHVAHAIIDGLINNESTNKAVVGLPQQHMKKINPDSIANTYWFVHSQTSDAWIHEFDLRPNEEKW
jgi:hypothetical protein